MDTYISTSTRDMSDLVPVSFSLSVFISLGGTTLLP